MKQVIDISLPIHNGMWHYRPEWENAVSTFESTNAGGQSTVYEMKLFSHTGTYIETSQHKLANDLLLDTLPIETFYRQVKVIVSDEKELITRKRVIEIAAQDNITIQKGDAVIIANGYGLNHRQENYLSASPSFEEELTEWLSGFELSLLGVDTPIIENPKKPYQPVIKLFKKNPEMLLLAPLYIDTNKVKTGVYTLCCPPLKIETVSGMLCRPLLIN